MSWDFSSEEVILEKLESQKLTISMLAQSTKKLREENERLREALSWYADKGNYKYINQYNKTLPLDDHDFNVNFSDKFGGKRARKALERGE